MGNSKLERIFDEGLVAMRKLRYNLAFDCFTAAMELEPEMPEVHYNRGVASSELYRWDDAEESFRMALRLQSHSIYRIHLGLTLLHKKQWERARQEFEKSLELDPESEIARMHKNDLDFYLTRDESDRGACPPLCVAWFDPRLEDFVGVDPVIVAKKERAVLREYVRQELDGDACDHTFFLTEEWAVKQGLEPIGVTRFLHGRDMKCDCEVLGEADGKRVPVIFIPPPTV